MNLKTKTSNHDDDKLFDLLRSPIQEKGIVINAEAQFVLLELTKKASLQIGIRQNKFVHRNFNRRKVDRRRARRKSFVIGKILIDTNLYSNFNKLSIELIKNSKGNSITVQTVMISLKNICPLWPFC